MKNSVYLCCILNLLVFSAQATDYHVCSNGSDFNSGLSHSTAWQTYQKAISSVASLNPGDSILFCKGENFTATGSRRVVNTSSTAGNRITISSYLPPGAPSDTENPTIFAASGGNAFSFEDGGNAEHDEGYVVSDLILRGSNSGKGIFIYNDADFIDIVDVEIYGFDIGVHLGGSNSPNAGSDGKNSDVTVRRTFIHDNSNQGFLGSGNNLLIVGSAFVNNGFARVILNHNIYLNSSNGNGINEVIRNNNLYQSAMFGGKCSGVSLVVHGEHTNLLIEDNAVWEDADATNPGCWGISVDNGYSGAFEHFLGLVIRGNTVVNTGNTGIGCALCPNAVIENNTIVHQIASIGWDAVRVPVRSENSASGPQSTNVTVRNNTIIYDSHRSGAAVVLGDGDGSTYTSSGNNTYYSPGSGMVADCETYPNNPPDVVNVVAGICQNSIPNALLNAALAKASTANLPTPKERGDPSLPQ